MCRNWKEAAEHPMLWQASESMLYSVLKMRCKLEIALKTLFPKFTEQLNLNPDENTTYCTQGQKFQFFDYVERRFDTGQYCGLKVRFQTLPKFAANMTNYLKEFHPLKMKQKRSFKCRECHNFRNATRRNRSLLRV